MDKSIKLVAIPFAVGFVIATVIFVAQLPPPPPTIDGLSMSHKTLHKILLLQELVSKPEIIDALQISNQEFAAITDIEAFLALKEEEWISTPIGEITPFMNTILHNEVSDIMRKHAVIQSARYGDIHFPELILTNAHGANVAISIKTDNYNQSIEDWWQITKEKGIHVRDPTWDQSAQIWSADICIKIFDDNGSFIGIINGATPDE